MSKVPKAAVSKTLIEGYGNVLDSLDYDVPRVVICDSESVYDTPRASFLSHDVQLVYKQKKMHYFQSKLVI